MNRVELRKKIYTTFKEILDENNNLVGIAQEFLDKMDITSVSEPYKMALALLFSEAYSRFLSTKILCEDGFGHSALIVQRSFMNLFFIMYWIMKKYRNSRARRYLGWFWKIMYERLKENPDEDSKESQNEIRNNYRKVRRYYRYKTRKGKIKKSNYWCEPLTIKQMAKEAGLESHYNGGYKPLSWVEHADPTDVLLRVKTGKIQYDPRFDEKWLKKALKTNCVYFSHILKTIDNTFSLGRKDKIQRHINKIMTFKE